MSITRVDPAAARELIATGGYVYLDVRSEQEFALGHPEGAYNIPLRHMAAQGMVDNPDFVASVEAHFKRDAKLVLGCRSGRRSLEAAELLRGAGFSSLIDQRAGFDGPRDAFGQVLEKGWQPCGLPCATEALPGRSAKDLAV